MSNTFVVPVYFEHIMSVNKRMVMYFIPHTFSIPNTGIDRKASKIILTIMISHPPYLYNKIQIYNAFLENFQEFLPLNHFQVRYINWQYFLIPLGIVDIYFTDITWVNFEKRYIS